MRVGAVLIVLALAWAGVRVVGADAGAGTITLSRGWNVVTWNGAEPYAIDNFADTPVTGVHRWDAASGQWLSRFVGRDSGSLPELHLLPRVQYLLIADATHELDVPDAVGGVDPCGALRFAGPPDDPLRFDAYWPNEDSPLEDLVVLRGEDERLSVRAEVSGGSGGVSVWWMIDGRVNHLGLASDDVDLTPGAHDHGRLFAVDDVGQVAFVDLPRVVRLPKLELPEMVYGVASGGVYGHWPRVDWQHEEELEWMREAGLTISRWDIGWLWIEARPGQINETDLEERDLWLTRFADRSMQALPIVANWNPLWATMQDVSSSRSTLTPRPLDVAHAQEHARLVARRWPQQVYWQIGNEPNLSSFWRGIDPWAFADLLKAVALGIWYENPEAVIVSAGLCCGFSEFDRDWEAWLWETHRQALGSTFLRALYEAGFGPWHDVGAVHYVSAAELDQIRAIMAMNGDGDKPLWVTESGVPTHGKFRPTGSGGVSESEQAAYFREHLQLYQDREDVRGMIVFMLADRTLAGCPGEEPHCGMGVLEELEDGSLRPKPAYWVIREFITGKSPPE